MVETVRNDHILFPFSAIRINNIFNENTNVLGKSQGPVALHFSIQQSDMTYKCDNSQNDHHGLSGVNQRNFFC